MKKLFTLLLSLMSALMLQAQQVTCDETLLSDAQIVYGHATITQSDSLAAQTEALQAAKEHIHQQLTNQLQHITSVYVQEYNSTESYKDAVKALTRISAAADRVMDKTTTQCAQTTWIEEEGLYQTTWIEQLSVEFVFRYIAENYNDRILNMDRFKDIYTNHLHYDQ